MAKFYKLGVSKHASSASRFEELSDIETSPTVPETHNMVAPPAPTQARTIFETRRFLYALRYALEGYTDNFRRVLRGFCTLFGGRFSGDFLYHVTL